MEIMRRLFTEEEGQGLVEYVMIIAVVVGFGVALGNSGVGLMIKNKITSIIGGAPDAPIGD